MKIGFHISAWQIQRAGMFFLTPGDKAVIERNNWVVEGTVMRDGTTTGALIRMPKTNTMSELAAGVLRSVGEPDAVRIER